MELFVVVDSMFGTVWPECHEINQFNDGNHTEAHKKSQQAACIR